MALPYQSPVTLHGLECFGVHIKAAGDLGWQAQRVLFELRPVGDEWLDRAKIHNWYVNCTSQIGDG